jgi:phospholipase/lecithinase/hemolysin
MDMKKIICFILALLCSGVNYAGDKYFDTMVILGDSLSDNGNLYRFLWHTVPSSPPYYEGHFSNGPVWIEQLYSSYFPADYTDGMNNYAVGGAGAVLSYKQQFPYTLVMELDNYLYWHTYGKKDSTLFTVWIGANNYLNGPVNVEPITDSVVHAIGKTVERLIQVGGSKFFIPNLPDLGRTPYAIEQGSQALLTELVQVHNRKLAAKIVDLKDKYPDATFVTFDVYSFFNEALGEANDYGFSHVIEPCYLGGYLGLLKPSDQTLKHYVHHLSRHMDSRNWEMIANNPQLKEAVAAGYLYQLLPKQNKNDAYFCDEYVFWDKIHPSTRAHELLAREARRALDEAGLISFVP